MSARPILAVALVVGLWAAPAQATPRLSTKRARSSITIYERSYWHGQHARVKLPDCHRDSARQIDCAVKVVRANRTLLLRDWATLLGHGVVRVHPGVDYEEIVVLS